MDAQPSFRSKPDSKYIYYLYYKYYICQILRYFMKIYKDFSGIKKVNDPKSD